MMWAFAKLNHSPDAALLHGCEAHATRISETIKPQGLVRCCLLQTCKTLHFCNGSSSVHPATFSSDTRGSSMQAWICLALNLRDHNVEQIACL